MPSRLHPVPQPGGIRIALDALQPFRADLARPISFGDLQAVFDMDLYTMRKAVRILRFAQLLDRPMPGGDHRPHYFLPKATVTLLTPTPAYRLERAKALGYFNTALEAVATHNASHVLSRVTSIAVKGTVLDPRTEVHEFVEVQVIVAVKPVDTLVQDIDHLVRSLRRIGDRALRISLVMESG
jgi:hypothetical protein